MQPHGVAPLPEGEEKMGLHTSEKTMEDELAKPGL
jgi:hypothetical protein